MLGLAALLALYAGPLPASPVALEAHAVLRRACARCHDGTAPKRNKGGFDSVLDAKRMESVGILPTLMKRIEDGTMPPGDRPLPPRDRATLSRWVAAGAPGLVPSRERLSYAAARRLALADRDAAPPRQRRFLRYLTLGHLALPEDASILRLAVAKLVNSLSRHPRLTVPHSLHEALLRLDLRDYRWTASLWDRLASSNPYRDEDKDGLVLRADWFVATASRPPFYHDFLQLPLSDKALERLVGADVAEALSEDRLVRAGFNNSGVARSNRVLDRIDGTHGAYWRSHDFAEGSGRKNVFESPVGFRADGGEIIFHLPNGLQAYFIVDAEGRRLDKAPGEVVQDPARPDRLVENGLSCMGCHAGGIIPKTDQVRAHVLGNKAFDAETREAALSLYVPHAQFRKRVEEDNARFRRALSSLGVSHEADPILASVLRFERVLDRSRLADELDVTPEGLRTMLEKVPELARAVAAGKGGTVRREVAESLWPRLLEVKAPAGSSPQPSLVEPVGLLKALATADGKTFLTGGADGRVRLWQGSKGKVIAKHPGDVLAVALSPDGLRIASASGREILIHDAAGMLVARLRGHTAEVRSMAFLDATRLASGSADRTARVWDLARSEETAAMAGHVGPVTSVTSDRAGKIVVTGSSDRTARWWDATTGRQLGQREAGAEIHAVAWGPGTLVAGTSTGKALRWDVRGDGPTTKLAGPKGTLRAVRLLGDGRVTAVSASGALAWRWDLSGKGWSGPEVGPVTAAAIAPDGTIVAATRDGVRVVPAP